jgi:ribosomal protein S18 acetylase RimI-like enzyme
MLAMPITIGPATAGDMPAARALIEEYCRWIDLDLAFQEIEAELDGLPGDYDPPAGAMLLARRGDRAVGVVAYRRLDAVACEMKRLYVQEEARGQGVSRALVVALMTRAAEAGYREIRLDTLPMMGAAQRLYESLGFRDIPPYYETPIAGTRFMACPLDPLQLSR